ncbi:Aminopeptidase [Zancudomyces culisetae]|uniref:Peptide hydrolase n=1 Tax=Zancudomyces culisetae TaxID=1213189 RepID=A0A1R1PJU6_ZANCU|nr:Aminopeptidase [Zancudomyces culisetae]|eukprot:OMH81241.1 Aminopeptidase [Zancudomyces culisetae]
MTRGEIERLLPRANSQALEEQAINDNNSRSTANGYNETASYVIARLKEAGSCDVTTQEFKVPVWTQLGDAKLELNTYDDNENLRYGGENATLENKEILYIPKGGCGVEKDDADVGSKIAIIETTEGCDLFQTAYALEQAGAAAVLVSTPKGAKKPSWARVRIVEWKEGDPLMSIPVLSITHSTFQTIMAAKNARLDLETNAKIDIHTTSNIICEGKLGARNSTIVVGAHLDSVAAGPGINDNGSGAASILEIFLTLSRSRYIPKNRLVFAWWGSEEDGLLGSRHFVRTLLEDQTNNPKLSTLNTTWSHIAMNLNFDMLGSPNYIPMIHNGSDAPGAARLGSEYIQSRFEHFFQTTHQPYKLTPMIAGSDFLPFTANGIPSGGCLTGASEIKTAEEAKTFGGMANAQLDPCYHQACDNLVNVNFSALNIMSTAALNMIIEFSSEKRLRRQLVPVI